MSKHGAYKRQYSRAPNGVIGEKDGRIVEELVRKRET